MSKRTVFRVILVGLPVLAVLNVVYGCIFLGWISLGNFFAAGLAMLVWYFLYWKTRHDDMWA